VTTIEVTTRVADLEAQITDLNREAADHSEVISECLLNASRLGKLDAEAYTVAHLGLEKCRIAAQGCSTALASLKELQSRAARIERDKREKLDFIDRLSALLDFKEAISIFNAKRTNGDRKRDAVFVDAMERVREFVSLANSLGGRAQELGLREGYDKVLAAMGLDQNGVNALLYTATLAAR
jgi:hypothetical protein